MIAQVGRPQLSNHGVGGGGFVAVLRAMRNGVLGNPAIGTNIAALSCAPFDYMIDGTTYSKGAQGSIPLGSLGLPVTNAGEVSRWRVEIDTAGAFLVTSVSKRSAALLGGLESVPAPPRTRGYCTVAVIGQPAGFNPGTTAASGLTIVNGDPDLMQAALIG